MRTLLSAERFKTTLVLLGALVLTLYFALAVLQLEFSFAFVFLVLVSIWYFFVIYTFSFVRHVYLSFFCIQGYGMFILIPMLVLQLSSLLWYASVLSCPYLRHVSWAIVKRLIYHNGFQSIVALVSRKEPRFDLQARPTIPFVFDFQWHSFSGISRLTFLGAHLQWAGLDISFLPL